MLPLLLPWVQQEHQQQLLGPRAINRSQQARGSLQHAKQAHLGALCQRGKRKAPSEQEQSQRAMMGCQAEQAPLLDLLLQVLLPMLQMKPS